MGATSVTGTGTGDSHKRLAYLSSDLSPLSDVFTTTNPQDLISVIPPLPPMPPSPIPDRLLKYLFFVSKNGDDSTATGAIFHPFKTIQPAIDAAYAVQDTMPTRPCVFVMAGTYVEDCILKPNVLVRGVGYNDTRVMGNWSIDNTWTTAGTVDWRSGWADIGLIGNANIDFAAVSANSGKLYASNVAFVGSQTITAFGGINQFLWSGGEWFGTITINGINTFLMDIMCQNFGTVFLNGTATGINYLTTSGGSYANIVVNATTFAFGCTFGHAVQDGATLTLNGPLSTIFANTDSIPLQSLIPLSGGASLSQIQRINQYYFSGITSNRPSAPYVGEQFFDTTIGLPIWWNGANWINAAGIVV
jgi:hypothetical protein